MQKVINGISKVTADMLSGIAKSKQSKGLTFEYRSIDDVFNGLAPALAKNGVVFLVDSIDVISKELHGTTKKTSASVKVRFAIRCEDEVVYVEAFGEADDYNGKPLASAASAAYKQAVLQAFCIPTKDLLDDSDKHKEEPPASQKTPPKTPPPPPKVAPQEPPKAPSPPQKYAFEEGETEGLLISIQEHFSEADLAEIDAFFRSAGTRPLVERTPEERAKAIVWLCSPDGIAKFEAHQRFKAEQRGKK